MYQKKGCSLLNVKTNYYPYNCRGTQKDVGTINLQVTYNARRECRSHDKCTSDTR